MRSFRGVMICVILVAWVAFGISSSGALHEETALMANKGRMLHDASGDFAQFGVSIFIGGPWDMDRCEEMVERVLKYPYVKNIQFVPTFFWYDKGPLDPPEDFDPSCDPSKIDLGSYYCYNRFNATEVQYWCYQRSEDGVCPEVTQEEMDQFSSRLGSCMSYATSKGLDISVNARVDDGRKLEGWRNTLVFDPTEKYSKWSFQEAVINPIIKALETAAEPGTRIDFVPQGEMGATVFFYPEEWKKVIQDTRSDIDEVRAAKGTEGPTLIGLGINNLKLCGCIGVGIIDGNEYIEFLSTSFSDDIYPQGTEAIRNTLKEADFISISAYVPMPNPEFDVCDFEALMKRMDKEMSYYGTSLKDLTSSGLEIHFGEFGVGGGVSQDQTSIAETAQQAAETPFFGIGGVYACDKDPFDMCNLENSNEVRDYRRRYYSQAAKYFQQDGCEYSGVKSAFIWGTGSWDVFNIYWGDDDDLGRGWTDPEVIEEVQKHNAKSLGEEFKGSD